MKRIITLLIMISLCGCKTAPKARIGFLSDYSNLNQTSPGTLSYLDKEAIKDYSKFIVEPVQVHYYAYQSSKGKLTDQEISDLTNYLHKKIVESIEGAGKMVVTEPGSGVARVRVALSDIKKSHFISTIPHASLLGAGIGGASMEGELIDSTTGKQIGAIIESGAGSKIPFSNLNNLNAAKKVIDDWAKRFQQRLIETGTTI